MGQDGKTDQGLMGMVAQQLADQIGVQFVEISERMEGNYGNGISVVVPVGPQPEYKQYLRECIESILDQAGPEDELILIDDMARLYNEEYLFGDFGGANIRVMENDWLLGCADSWNIGVSIAFNEHIIMMGSDDKLLPGCMDACRAIIRAEDYDSLGYYNLTCELSDGQLTTAFNNAAMVSKSLWNLTGGFPPSAGIGAPDALLISIMMVHLSEHLHQIREGDPLYWARIHDAQETPRQAGTFNQQVIDVRNIETQRWKAVDWT